MTRSKDAKSAASTRKSKSKLSTLTLDSSADANYEPSASIPHSAVSEAPKNSKPLASFAKPFPLAGKGKSSLNLSKESTLESASEDNLWIDKYVPETEEELAVHKKKVEDVRRWLTEALHGGPTGVLKKYRRVLALTGPAGSGKTAVLHVLARELDFEIVEWCNTLDEKFAGDENENDRESLVKKFQDFLARASSCAALPLVSSTTSYPAIHSSSRKIILLEDLPNVLHSGTANTFYDALEDFIDTTSDAPLVIVVSDAGTRGEDSEGDLMGSRRWEKQVMDVRSVVPPTIFNSPYFTEIHFNPVAPTLLIKALTSLLARHFSSPPFQTRSSRHPSKDTLQMIAESAQGDIRSAIMALQFVCVVQLPKGQKKGGASAALEVITRREQSLALFHMLGKVLYNKRKGDPPNTTATAKGREREDERDTKIVDPAELPPHLVEHARRGSRVDVNTLFADSPIDTSLFSLYLHHNYTQFCNEVDECYAVCEWLSWIDAGCGDPWQRQNDPHKFHILTLGTLHGLPSPVPRRSQKIFKPEFFDVLKKINAAEQAVTDTEAWINTAVEVDTEGGRRWGRDEVVLEIGGILKALGSRGTDGPPSTHDLFTALPFVHPARMPSHSQRMQQLEEEETPGETFAVNEVLNNTHSRARQVDGPPEKIGGWLESDDIEEF